VQQEVANELVRLERHGMLALGIVAAMVLVVVTPLSSNQIRY
jgi:hypothetical protein